MITSGVTLVTILYIHSPHHLSKSHGHDHEWSIHIPLIPCQSALLYFRLGYFKHWLWKIQGQGHGRGQRSRSHNWPSIQPMYFLFISCQSDQPFLRYGQYSVWPWKNISEIKKKCRVHHLQQACWVPNGLRTWKHNASGGTIKRQGS